MPAQFIASAEGFDIYPSGTLAANYPWFVTNSAIAGQINLSAGAFGGAALTFPVSGAPTSLTSGFEYQFPSTMQIIRGNTTTAGKGAFAINFWLNVNTMNPGSGTLLALGTAGVPGSWYPLLNISNSSSGVTNRLKPLHVFQGHFISLAWREPSYCCHRLCWIQSCLGNDLQRNASILSNIWKSRDNF